MRCLSCEIGTNFAICDNLVNGGVVCHNFQVPDEKARGLRRSFSLALMAQGGTGSPTSILSSFDVIFPRLEKIGSELAGGANEDDHQVNLVSALLEDKKKALTFVHIRMAQVLTQLSFQCEEFVQFRRGPKLLLAEEARIGFSIKFRGCLFVCFFEPTAICNVESTRSLDHGS
jgi:hypothetical protein